MTAPRSLSPSSTNSCLSDSETSNDSGIDSMSGGSLPPEYMDLDEFLNATGVKNVDTQSNCSSSVVSNTDSHIDEDQKTINGHTSQSQRESTDNTKYDTFETKKYRNKTVATKAQNSRNKDDEDYNYKYNPLPVKKKAKRKFVSDQEKDELYWKRRIRNNEAARRSRDMRRQREIEISSKWKELEEENARLKKELQKLKERANKLEKQLMDKKSN